MLEIHTDTNVIPGATYVALSGKIGIPESEEIKDFVDERIEEDVWLVINLKNISFICSSGLGALLSSVGKCRENGGDIIFIEISPKLEMIFEFLDVMDYILHRPHITDAARLLMEIKPSDEDRISAEEIQFAVNAVKSGDIAAALPVLNKAISATPDDVQLLTWYGFAVEQAGRTDEARSIYEGIKETAPNDTRAYEFALSRLNHLEKAPFSEKNLDTALAGLQKATPPPLDATSATFYSTERGISGGENGFILTLGPWYAGDHDPLGNPLFGRSGGVYLWYAGKGIVIDPGKDFENLFYKNGGHLSDIDIIIVTSDAPTIVSSAHRILRGINELYQAGSTETMTLIVDPGAYRALSKWYSIYSGNAAEIQVFEEGSDLTFDSLKVWPVFDKANNDTDVIASVILGGGEKSAIYALRPIRGQIPIFPDWTVSEKILLAVIGNVFEEGRLVREENGLGFKETARFIRYLQPGLTLCLRIQGINQPLLFAETMSKSSEKKVIVPGDGWYIQLEDYSVKNTEGGFSQLESLEIEVSESTEIKFL